MTPPRGSLNQMTKKTGRGIFVIENITILQKKSSARRDRRLIEDHAEGVGHRRDDDDEDPGLPRAIRSSEVTREARCPQRNSKHEDETEDGGNDARDRQRGVDQGGRIVRLREEADEGNRQTE